MPARCEYVKVFVPSPLKRDLQKIAARENRKLSPTCAGLLRLGIGRYFELDGERSSDGLRSKMRDLFEEDPAPPVYDTPALAIPYPYLTRSERTIRERKGKQDAHEFDLAIEEGNKRFEAARR